MNNIAIFFRFLILACCFWFFSTVASASAISGVNSNSAAREIYLQLTELASANVDYRFAQELSALQKASHKGGNIFQRELMKSYFLLKTFRRIYASSTWEQKQNNEYKLPKKITISTYEQENYYNLIKDHKVFYERVVALRPQTPNYLNYRHEILKNISLIGTESKPYPFKILKFKTNGTEINILKTALKKAGYLDVNCPQNGFFDTELLYAVKRFQTDHMIKADGIVGYGTYSLLFQTPAERSIRLARAILRLGDRSLLKSSTYLLVNIPDTEMYVYKDGLSIFNSKVIVGTAKRPTPRLASTISQVVLNPTWTVPPTIRNDYLTHLKRDPTYLEKHGINIIDENKNVLNPRLFDFSTYTDEKDFPFLMVQAPGPDNALGLYKFLFPNEHFVFLHSTSSPHYFTKATRTLSSGCVRVQKSRELAEFLLKNTAYTPKHIKEVIESKKTRYIKPTSHTRVYLAYWTAYISETGQVFYRPDPYGLDKNTTLPLAVRNVR